MTRTCKSCGKRTHRKDNHLPGCQRQLPAADRTHCPAGHEYTEANTRRDRWNKRKCKTCDNARKKAAWRNSK